MECLFIQTHGIKSMTCTHMHRPNHQLWLLNSLLPHGVLLSAQMYQRKKNALWTKFKLISLLLTLKYERKFQSFPQIEWWNHHHWDDVFTTSWSVHNKLWGSLTSIKNNSLAHFLFYKLIGESMVRTPPAWGIYLISHWGHLCQEYTCLPYTKEI